ncbi:MAG: hypothetical protein ACRDYA_19565 [Egibacteraceae bacterium]
MRVARGTRMSTAKRRLLIIVMVALPIMGVAVLQLWATPSPWSNGPRFVTMAALGWVRTHLLTATVAGLVISIAGPEDGCVFSCALDGSVALKRESVIRRVWRVARRAGVQVDLCRLRYFMGAAMLREGKDLWTVAGRLGHAVVG